MQGAEGLGGDLSKNQQHQCQGGRAEGHQEELAVDPGVLQVMHGRAP